MSGYIAAMHAGRPAGLPVRPLLVAGLLAASLLVATPTSPAAAASRHRPTVAAVLHALRGQSVVYTPTRSRATILRFTKLTLHKWGTRWYPVVTVTHLCEPHCPQAAGRSVTFVSGPDGPMTLSGHPLRTAHPDTHAGTHAGAHAKGRVVWWNPFTWHWHAIWSWVWEHLAVRCMKGAVGGVGTLLSATIAKKLIVRGGSILPRAGMRAVGSAAAEAAIAGCLFNITFGVIQ